MEANLIIIGTGLAGYMLAKEWRKLEAHAKLIIITADDGNFYSKPLLSTAFTQQKTADTLVVTDAQTMAKDLNATILTHTIVLGIDREQQEVILTNKRIPYSQLVLACGAETIAPPLSGNAVNEIQTVNNLIAYKNFRQWLEGKNRIGIIGTGLVGCEFANDLLNAGYQITVIAPDSYPLAALIPHSIGIHLKEKLAEKGISWHLDHFALSVNRYQKSASNEKIINHPGGDYQIELDNGEIIFVDGVFSAIGLRPNLRLAHSAGLQVEYGISVDRFLRTSDPNIYALGDCAQVSGVVKQYVAPILQCAKALAKGLIGQPEPVHYPIMPIVIKTPACPLVVYPPGPQLIGEWQIEGEPPHLQALFHDQEGQLQGYALIGDRVRDKMALAKQLPLVFSD